MMSPFYRQGKEGKESCIICLQSHTRKWQSQAGPRNTAAKLGSSYHTGCLLDFWITAHNQPVFGIHPAWRQERGRFGELASESLCFDKGRTHTKVSCRWDPAVWEQGQGDLEGRAGPEERGCSWH